MSDAVVCSSGCKQGARDAGHASVLGWECLPISGRWRCPDCHRALERANGYIDGLQIPIEAQP